ncbi:MAG: UvrB/UvrC motif-containing protein, partial [Actinobacteria bacterium]|nr:UvrB/UvrC motif-containing protein [Actinomycetota bacterium]
KEKAAAFSNDRLLDMDFSKIDNIISGLEEEMHMAAKELDFEKAAFIRDEITKIKNIANIQND